MRQSRARSLALICSILLLVLLSACGGDNNGSTSVGPPATVTLNPQPSVSLTAGDVLAVNVSVLDATGKTVLSQTASFTSSNPRIQIASSGTLGALLCAGTWLDAQNNPSLTSPIKCRAAGSAGTPDDPPLDGAGIQANITATAGGITSNAVAVSVHLPVTSIEIITVSPTPAPACVKQTETVQFAAIAKGIVNGTLTDITASVGNINWQVLTGQVATASPLTTAGKIGGSDPTTVTAKLPGKTQIVASVNSTNSVNSVPATFTECPVARIEITPATGPPTTLSGAGATVQMSAKVFDTTGAEITNPAPTLSWSSNPVAVSTVNASGLVTAALAGTSSIVAGCNPSSCNINLEPVFSSVASVTVEGSSSTTVYATSTSAATPSLFVITANAGSPPAPAGSAPIPFPNNQKPNSLVFSPTGARAFFGSTAGLMVMDANNNTFIATVTTAPGKVLAVSPDGNTVLISDAGAAQLRVFTGNNNTVTNFNVPNATAAAFTPDGSKAYIVSGDKGQASSLFVFQSGAISSLALGSAVGGDSALSDQFVTFLPNGSAAYVANGTTSRIRTCDNLIVSGPGANPLLVGAVPGKNQVLAIDPDNINAFDVTITEASGSVASACPTVSEGTPATHGTGNTALPKQLILTLDGNKAFVTSAARPGTLLAYDVASGIPSMIALVGPAAGTATTTTGGATLDSTRVFVGATDNQVHMIDVVSGTDTNQIDVGFTPELVAVRPH